VEPVELSHFPFPNLIIRHKRMSRFEGLTGMAKDGIESIAIFAHSDFMFERGRYHCDLGA